MADVEFRIEYTIQRIDPGDDDFVDIGFGSSGGWNSIDAALYAMSSDVQNRLWETEAHMPDPADAEGDEDRGKGERSRAQTPGRHAGTEDRPSSAAPLGAE